MCSPIVNLGRTFSFEVPSMSQGLLYVLMILALACKSDESSGKKIGYDLNEPAEVLILEKKLTEISGLTLMGHYLIAVEDEKGNIYLIDRTNGEIAEKADFWKDGDFEGIELVGSYLFALKSNGNLYRVEADNPNAEHTENYDLGFSGNDNFEGLGYQPDTDKLLLASKRSPDAGTKEIYAISPDEISSGLRARQVYIVDQAQLHEHQMKQKKRWIDRFAQGIATANYSFNPSGIAVHPHSGDIFILSSPNPQLLVLNKNWKIKSLMFLDPIKFKQPEGICFDPEGTLFIANEGREGKANILKFLKQ